LLSGHIDKLIAACAGCCFFIIEKGYIGLSVASHKAKTGDGVCLLRSTKLPLILREVEGGCGSRLVGRCYTQGIMRGEVWRENLEAGKALKTFTLVWLHYKSTQKIYRLLGASTITMVKMTIENNDDDDDDAGDADESL
jgi:hypothetical protein